MPGEYSIDQVTNSGVVGNDLYNQLFGAQGFSGIGDGYGGYNPAGGWNAYQGGTNEGGQLMPGGINQEALDSYKDFSFDYTPTGNESGFLKSYDPSGTLQNTFEQKGPSSLSKFIGAVAPMAFAAASGGLLAPAFGGGMLGGALGYGGASGGMAALQGGDLSQVGKAALSGAIGGAVGGMGQGIPEVMGNNPSAYVPAQAGTSFANMAGVSNPTLGNMFNKGVGSAIGTAATGGNLKDIATNALTSAGTAGLNSMGKSMGNSFSDMWNSFSSPQADEFAYSSNPAENASYPEGSMSSSRQNYYDILGQEPPQASMPSAEMYSNTPFNTTGMEFSPMSGNSSGMKTAQSAGTGFGDSGGSSLASYMPSGSSVGNYLGSHGGDLASMLYGFYNNKKQQRALQGQQEGLQGLYGQNSPYAQQLRANLAAKGAASGRRINSGGREVQLQAMLADRAASMAPTMYQMQQGQNNLQNNRMNMLLQGANKMGAFKAMGNGLQGMFSQPSGSLTGPGSMTAYGNMDDMYSNMLGEG